MKIVKEINYNIISMVNEFESKNKKLFYFYSLNLMFFVAYCFLFNFEISSPVSLYFQFFLMVISGATIYNGFLMINIEEEPMELTRYSFLILSVVVIVSTIMINSPLDTCSCYYEEDDEIFQSEF